ncbi:MAG: hypothetical protein AUJ34_00275 [Parcubacteria group bacterium CG1_02_41_12]|nr:MAG: hypothetical protein AUJ34_00275 [Parcubacteria group bacterium CG1_02_41_12]PIQ80229.1 MAG: hypothetical protein COV79_01580 [Parcubacteria group bacterium CG11_big_fil_rev_8_21_14_0_20_41_14]
MFFIFKQLAIVLIFLHFNWPESCFSDFGKQAVGWGGYPGPGWVWFQFAGGGASFEPAHPGLDMESRWKPSSKRSNREFVSVPPFRDRAGGVGEIPGVDRPGSPAFGRPAFAQGKHCPGAGEGADADGRGCFRGDNAGGAGGADLGGDGEEWGSF